MKYSNSTVQYSVITCENVSKYYPKSQKAKCKNSDHEEDVIMKLLFLILFYLKTFLWYLVNLKQF